MLPVGVRFSASWSTLRWAYMPVTMAVKKISASGWLLTSAVMAVEIE